MKNIDDRLHNYAERLQEYTRRKRGNEPWYLEWVESVKPKECAVCGSRENVQLHHIDGDWRNPWLHNVKWLCYGHHREADRLLSQHKEKNMTSKRIKWSPSMIDKMKEFYNKHENEGMTKDWCHYNFRFGDAEANFYSNKGAYTRYILGYTRPGQKKSLKPSWNTHSESVSYNKVAGTITLSQILKYQKVCESVGLKFIID